MSRPVGVSPPVSVAPALDALALRLAGWVLLAGGGMLLGALLIVLRLPHVAGPGGIGFAVPGTGGRHLIAPAVVPVLGLSGGGLAALGLLALAAARWRPAHARPMAARRRPAWRGAAILVGGVALLVAVLLRR